MGTRSSRLLGPVVDVLLCLLAVDAGLLRDAGRLGWVPMAVEPAGYLLSPGPAVIVALHVVGALVLLAHRRARYVVAVVLAALSVVVPLFSALFATYAVARCGGRLTTVVALAERAERAERESDARADGTPARARRAGRQPRALSRRPRPDPGWGPVGRAALRRPGVPAGPCLGLGASTAVRDGRRGGARA